MICVRRPSRLTALVVPLALLVGVGCAKATTPSQGEYTAAADGVCQAADDRMEELQEELEVERWVSASGGDPTINVERPERWMRVKIVPAYRSMSGGLKGLPPPDGDAAYLTDLYADLDRLIEFLHSHPSRGRDVVRTDEELRRRFASYGMETCGTV